jgi:thiol:disulfide interchange protein DsbC
MYKIFLTIFMISTIISCSGNINNTEDARNAMEEKYPNIKIDLIEQVNNSFFEITIQDQMYYLTSDFKHLIVGNVIDFETGNNLTENRLKKERVKYLSNINNNNIIAYEPEKTKYVITIFTDTSCPYCQKYIMRLISYC